MHRAKPVADKLDDDYFVILKRRGHHRWKWEIQRRSKPLGIKFDGDEYTTAQDAKLAGEKALNEFLRDLSQR